MPGGGLTGQPRFRLLVVATAVLLGIVLLTSQCGGNDTATAPDATSRAAAPPTTAAAVTVTTADGAEPEDGATTTTGATGTSTTVTTTAPRPGDPDAPLADPATTGRELAQRFLDILTQRDPGPALEEFLSPSFQLQRANGTYADREEYLDAPSSVVRATILPDGFRAYQDGAVLTVRFSVDIAETVAGASLQSRQADRLAVFRRGTDGWKLVAWANFNPPS